MDALLNRAVVVLTAAVTYIVAGAAALTLAADQIAAAAPPGAEDVVTWLVRAAAWLTAAVTIIRRVTPVPAGLRGLAGVTDVSTASWPAAGGGTYSFIEPRATGTANTTVVRRMT